MNFLIIFSLISTAWAADLNHISGHNHQQHQQQRQHQQPIPSIWYQQPVKSQNTALKVQSDHSFPILTGTQQLVHHQHSTRNQQRNHQLVSGSLQTIQQPQVQFERENQGQVSDLPSFGAPPNIQFLPAILPKPNTKQTHGQNFVVNQNHQNIQPPQFTSSDQNQQNHQQLLGSHGSGIQILNQPEPKPLTLSTNEEQQLHQEHNIQQNLLGDTGNDLDLRNLDRPTFSNSPPTNYRPLDSSHCPPGLLADVYGECVQPAISKNLFFYSASKNAVSLRKRPVAPKPKILYNIVFVHKPEDEDSDPIIAPPPQQKTLVYVLSKKSEEEEKVHQVPVYPEIKPEVFFVNYNDEENANLPGGIDLRSALSQLVEKDDKVVELRDLPNIPYVSNADVELEPVSDADESFSDLEYSPPTFNEEDDYETTTANYAEY